MLLLSLNITVEDVFFLFPVFLLFILFFLFFFVTSSTLAVTENFLCYLKYTIIYARWLAVTHYYKFATQSLFPLLKDTIYASYNISIKHHITYTALSNMNNVVSPQKVNVYENNMQWTRFKTTPVMPVYFLAIGIVRLDCIVSLNIRLFCRKDMLPHVKFAHTVATDIAWFLNEKLPNIRKTLETNHIVIPELFDAEEIMLGFILHR